MYSVKISWGYIRQQLKPQMNTLEFTTREGHESLKVSPSLYMGIDTKLIVFYVFVGNPNGTICVSDCMGKFKGI